jgi:adenylate kinase
MFRIIYEEDRNDLYTIRILDGHFIYFEAVGKNFSVRNIHNEDHEQMKAIFVVNSTPENILNRRTKDISERNDRVIDFNYIQEQLELEKNEAIKQAKELSISIDFINNNGDLKETIQEIDNKVRERLNLPSEIKENNFGKIKLS